MAIRLPKWLNTRAAPEVPDKVFVYNDGDNKEYSPTEPQGIAARRFDDLFFGRYSSSNFIELFYSLPEIFAPVHEIASRVADANWQLIKEWNDEVDWNNAFFNQLFTQPNALMSHKQLIYQAVCYEILTGKQFFHFKKVGIFPEPYKNIVSWWNLPAHKVSAVLKKNVDVYDITVLNDLVQYYEEGNKRFQTDEIIPICNLDLRHPTDINCSVSQLRGATPAIKNLIPVYEARGVIYIKRGAMGFVVSRKSDESGQQVLTKGEKKQVEQDFQSSQGVTRGKNPVVVTSVPVDFIKTSMSIQELEPFNETLIDAMSIYKVLRVPKHLVPDLKNSTFANADADMKSFYTDVILPIAKRYAQIETSYFKFDRRYIKADFEHISFLQKNRKEEADVDKVNGDVWLIRWKNSACSLNEWIQANGGTPGVGPMFDKKLLELTPDELLIVKSIISNGAAQQTQTENPGAQAPGGANKL